MRCKYKLMNDRNPRQSIFFLGAHLLKHLEYRPDRTFMDLYFEARSKMNITMDQYILTLDWLFLIEAAKIDEKGIVRLCD